MWKRYFGDRAFYKKLMLIALPIMIQNGVTNFVSLLDNLMVGQIGTEQMSGVAIANQLIFVYNLFVFGGVSGAGIFGAQFFGKKDYEGVKHTFQFKFVLCGLITLAAILIMWVGGDQLIALYLHSGGDDGNLKSTLLYGEQYLHIMLVGLVGFFFSQLYASTLRESGETILPLIAGMTAVGVNLVLDYGLIFGKLGLPQMGVQGAALATVIARFAEIIILILLIRIKRAKFPFMFGLYRGWNMSKKLVGNMLKKGIPLVINEGMWGFGMAFLTQIYSQRGLAVVAGLNISNTMQNLFNVVFLAMGNAIGIIIGQKLGAGKMEEAVEDDRKLIVFTEILVVFTALGVIALSRVVPNLYNTTDNVRELASSFMVVAGLSQPIFALMNSIYFTLRSGGNTVVTFLFDSGFLWAVEITLAYALCRFTGLNIVTIFFMVNYSEIIKCIIGFVLLKKGVWINNIVGDM